MFLTFCFPEWKKNLQIITDQLTKCDFFFLTFFLQNVEDALSYAIVASNNIAFGVLGMCWFFVFCGVYSRISAFMVI